MFKAIGTGLKFILKSFLELISEGKNGGSKISIGRISFLIVLFAALHIWLMVPVVDIQPNMMMTLAALLGYVLGTKAITSWTAIGSLKATNGNNPPTVPTQQTIIPPQVEVQTDGGD